jgi:predicted dehydrogenase
VHLPALAARDDVEIVVVCRRDGDLAARIAKRFGVAHAVTDYREALELGLDAVVVASPPNVHEEQVVGALTAGAHVLCEKPFAIDAAAAWRMVDAARQTGKHLLVAFGWNHMPIMQAARRMIVSRSLGKVEFMTLNLRVATRRLLAEGRPYNVSSEEVPPEPETFIDPVVSGGGQAPVSMSHALGLAMFLGNDRARSVHAQMWNAESGLDIHDAMTLTLAGGGIATVTAASSHESAARVEWEAAVFGPGGQLMLDSVHGEVRFAPVDGPMEWADLAADSGTYEPTGPLRELLDVAHGGSPGDASPAELGAHTVELVEAAYRSAASGSPEVLAPRAEPEPSVP